MAPSKTNTLDTFTQLNSHREPISQRILGSLLHRAITGRLTIVWPHGEIQTYGRGPGEDAVMQVHDGDLFKKLLAGGSMALGESYVDGSWDSPDISAVLRLLGSAQHRLGRITRGLSKVSRGLDVSMHALRRNTPEQAKKNIGEHYDLSNDLYALFLDPTMTYSSALFEAADEDLETAQWRKIDRLIDQLDIKDGDRILEIGSGWGACAIRMAQRFDCTVLSLTLSEEQQAEASRRVAEAGLSDRVEIRLQDYRSVEEQFDHAISVEMIEAVGHEFLPEYFQQVNNRLKPGGGFALQSITIPEDRYAAYTKGTDWIRKHIFPGGHLPSPELIHGLVKDHTDWAVRDEFEFGRHYAETLRRWDRLFVDASDEVSALGFDERFQRKWRYYFAYCEAGFDTELIHVWQYGFRKPV